MQPPAGADVVRRHRTAENYVLRGELERPRELRCVLDEDVLVVATTGGRLERARTEYFCECIGRAARAVVPIERHSAAVIDEFHRNVVRLVGREMPRHAIEPDERPRMAPSRQIEICGGVVLEHDRAAPDAVVVAVVPDQRGHRIRNVAQVLREGAVDVAADREAGLDEELAARNDGRRRDVRGREFRGGSVLERIDREFPRAAGLDGEARADHLDVGEVEVRGEIQRHFGVAEVVVEYHEFPRAWNGAPGPARGVVEAPRAGFGVRRPRVRAGIYGEGLVVGRPALEFVAVLVLEYDRPPVVFYLRSRVSIRDLLS